MKNHLKSIIAVDVLGVLLARATLVHMNPIAVGFYGAALMIKQGRVFTFLAICLGLFSAMPIEIFSRYVVLMLLSGITIAILGKKTQKLKGIVVGGCMLGITLLTNLSSMFFYPKSSQGLEFCILEAIIVFVFVPLFYKGIEWMEKGKINFLPDNEEIVSIALMIGFAIYGVVQTPMIGLYAALGCACLCTLYFGYKYGIGFGTVISSFVGIAVAVSQESYIWVGIFCIFGLMVGIFREMGRILLIFSYGLVLFVSANFDIDMLAGYQGLEAMIVAGVIFLLLPKDLVRKVDVALLEENLETIFARDNIQSITRVRLREFSQAFYQLASTFNDITKKKKNAQRGNVTEVMEDLSESICAKCEKCNLCWKKYYSDTYNEMKHILSRIEEEGYLPKDEVPVQFQARCKMSEQFLQESTRRLAAAKLNMSWENRLTENREAIAGQLSEVASIIDEFSLDLYRKSEVSDSLEEQIKHALKKKQILATQVAIFEKKDKRQQVYMMARALKGQCITTKEVAAIVGDVIGKRMRATDSTKNVITKTMDIIAFTEDVAFKVLTGSARVTKDGEKVSGDSFSIMNLENGQLLLSLSDGMGTGVTANEESESVIELLEQFMEAGFHEESAIRLINSILVLRSDEQSFSTIDLSILNLYTGVCDFVKIGASSTYIRRDHMVETICSTSMPVGMFNQVDFDQKTKKLYDGDYIVMMTDGVLDCIKEKNKDQFIEELLQETNLTNPQDIADEIMKKALEENDGVAIDDCTVLVAGFWKK